jgi:Ca2+-transporting ATPase
LAFATIPEELPILIKCILGVGAVKLAQSNLLIKKLATAANLGGVDTILIDKTGTLTQNTLCVEVLGMYDRLTQSTQLTQEAAAREASTLPYFHSLLHAWVFSCTPPVFALARVLPRGHAKNNKNNA